VSAPKYFNDPEPGRVAVFLQGVHADVLDWCAGRSWVWRLPVLVWLGYVGVRQFLDNEYSVRCLFGGINLGIHEGGHLLTGSMGQFVCSAAGSFLQCFVPVASMFMFLRQRDYFGIAVCFGWLATNLVGVGVYMSDARAMALPLVTVGGGGGNIEQMHDWHYLFARMGLLRSCETIGALTRALGHLSLLVCLVGGGWLLWQMFKHPKPA
jgi:hypothetical protein